MKRILLLLVLCTSLLSTQIKSQTVYNSLAVATATIYLDFNGEYVTSPLWNNGDPFTALPAALSEAQKTSIYKRVAEDFRPFEINVTTDEAVYFAAPIDKRIRVIVTPTSSWFSGVGGVSYIGSFTWGDDTPCFVFSDRLGNSSKYIAECCSHETGHALGLSHQSKYDGSCNLTATYNDGIGTGEAAWAPIMGNSYYRNMSGWNNGPTPYGCGNTQDNLTILTTQNGFSYRADDHGDDINTSPTSIDITAFTVDGIISTNTDKDAFTFTLSENSNILVDVLPFSVGANNEGADVDIKVYIYDGSKNLIRTYDPSNTMSVNIDTILSAGDYYLVVDGTGNVNATDYGSIGSYSLKGISTILPVKNITLSGYTQNRQHLLNWEINNYDDIQSITIETSTDGVRFYTQQQINGNQNSVLLTPPAAISNFYRIKLTTHQNQIKYSNIIALKNNTTVDQIVIGNTNAQSITIQSNTVFEYQVIDLNGRVLAKGKNNMGSYMIDMSRYCKGLYIVTVATKNTLHTKKILLP
jgi:hypothetical protein